MKETVTSLKKTNLETKTKKTILKQKQKKQF